MSQRLTIISRSNLVAEPVKVKVVPFIGSEEVTPGHNWVCGNKNRVAEMKRLMKQYPGIETFEIETVDGESMLAEYTVKEGEPKLNKDAKRSANEPPPVPQKKAPAKLEDLEASTETTANSGPATEEFDQGPESNRRIVDGNQEHPEEAKIADRTQYERGLASKTIIDTMEAGPCTRKDILAALQATFPTKPEKQLRNTMGALVHMLINRQEQAKKWTVEKIPDPDDSRKITYSVTVLDGKSEESQQAA